MGERIKLRRLTIVGPSRYYEVPFFDGVNVIAGPIFTGKSSVLQLIDYALGAKRAPRYHEISKCTEIYLELEAGGEVLTIRRSLKDSSARATLFEASIEDALGGIAKGVDVSARHDKQNASISLSILARLGLAGITVKTAPTKDASDLSSFSIRDLLLVVYVAQHRVGAKHAFFEAEAPKRIKWHAAFEIVHQLFDEAVAKLADALKQAESEEFRIRTYLANAQEFLDKFQVPTLEHLENDFAATEQQLATLRAELRASRTTVEHQLGLNYPLLERRTELDRRRTSADARRAEFGRTLEQLGRLRVQYHRELTQLEFMAETELAIGSLPVVRCPHCFQSITSEVRKEDCYVCKQSLPTSTDSVPIENRLRAGRRRISDLDDYMGELRATLKDLETDARQVESELQGISGTLARIEQTTLLPFTRAAIEKNETISQLENGHKRLTELILMRKRAQGEGSALLAVAERVARLRSELRTLEAQRPSPDAVVDDLSILFSKLLKDIHFPELRGARLDRTSYLPFVRDQPYSDLSSSGAIGLAVTCWHLSLLLYAVEEHSRFPCLLLIDSPLSHVGRDANDPVFKDQQVVDGFYQILGDIHSKWAAKCQIIICENRPPKEARNLVRVEFTRDPTRGRYGLIDDEQGSEETETKSLSPPDE